MPVLKVDHIVSFSSEDPIHTASNLLLSDPSKKWKCKSQGERSAIAVLQLEKASVISAIDVGNENAAYIEILVTRSGLEGEYKVLVVMSSLMSPLESRQGTNINRVRMFTTEHLSKPECEQKWDRIKIVCTQPFNRHVQYGLSFVTFHSSESNKPSQNTSTIGKFTIRPQSPDTFTPGMLFLRKKEEEQLTPPTAAAAIRKAGHTLTPVQKTVNVTKKLRKKACTNSGDPDFSSPKRRNDIALLYDEEEQQLTSPKREQKKDNILQKDVPKALKRKGENSEKTSRKEETKKLKTTHKVNTDETPSTSKHLNGKDTCPPKKAKSKVTKSFSRLLEGVTVVISGIQNPDRSDLRTKALAMGAKYSGDWNNTCSHLICAFRNTPKFNQVRGKGKIVTRNWIEDCYNQRKRLPWRRYCLDKNDKDKEESEEEIDEEVCIPDDKKINISSGSDTESYDNVEAGSDTEERIQRILKHTQKHTNEGNQQNINGTDFYSADTESDNEPDNDFYTADTESENEPNNDFHTADTESENEFNSDFYSADTEPENEPNSDNEDGKEPNFKNLFAGKTFFIDSEFDQNSHQQLRKYITAYNGIIVDDPTENVDIYVTNESKSEEVADINPSIKCIRPEWIWQCHNKQELVSFDNYLL